MKGLSTFFTLSSLFFRFLDTENRLLYGITTDTRPPVAWRAKRVVTSYTGFYIFLFFIFSPFFCRLFSSIMSPDVHF